VEEDHSQGVRRRYRAMTSVMLDPGGACGAQLPRVGAPPCRTYSRYQPGWVSEWRMRHWPCFGRCGTQIRSPLRNRNFADSPLEGGRFELLVRRHRIRGFQRHSARLMKPACKDLPRLRRSSFDSPLERSGFERPVPSRIPSGMPGQAKFPANPVLSPASAIFGAAASRSTILNPGTWRRLDLRFNARIRPA